MYIRIYIHTHIYMRMYGYMCVHVHEHTHTHTHTHTQVLEARAKRGAAAAKEPFVVADYGKRILKIPSTLIVYSRYTIARNFENLFFQSKTLQ